MCFNVKYLCFLSTMGCVKQLAEIQQQTIDDEDCDSNNNYDNDDDYEDDDDNRYNHEYNIMIFPRQVHVLEEK